MNAAIRTLRCEVGLAATALATAALLLASSAGAATCTVPGTHLTLQAAASDPGCTPIVLAAATYTETVTVQRSVRIEGAGAAATTVVGRVVAVGPGVAVELAALTIDATTADLAGCYAAALDVADGATVTAAEDVEVRNAAGSGEVCPLFADGFEGGTTAAWSAARPP